MLLCLPLCRAPHTQRKGHRSSDPGADWPAQSARTVHSTARSSGTHPRPPGPPNPPRRGHTPRVMSSRRGFGGGRSTGAGQLPRSRRGTNRTVAIAVARATSTCRPRTSVRPSERETVPLDARRRVASLGATAERVGLGVNSYRDARRPTTGSSRRSALGTCLLGRQHVRLPQPNQRTAAPPCRQDSRWFRCLEPSVKFSNA